MRFIVIFKGSNAPAVYLQETEVGLTMIDYVRDALGRPDIGSHAVNDRVWALREESIEHDVHEDEARASGHFGSGTKVAVEVAPRYLNRFAMLATEPTYRTTEPGGLEDEEDAAIERVSLQWEIDPNRLIFAWIEAGYPLRWGFDDEAAPPSEADLLPRRIEETPGGPIWSAPWGAGPAVYTDDGIDLAPYNALMALGSHTWTTTQLEYCGTRIDMGHGEISVAHRKTGENVTSGFRWDNYGSFFEAIEQTSDRVLRLANEATRDQAQAQQLASSVAAEPDRVAAVREVWKNSVASPGQFAELLTKHAIVWSDSDLVFLASGPALDGRGWLVVSRRDTGEWHVSPFAWPDHGSFEIACADSALALTGTLAE